MVKMARTNRPSHTPERIRAVLRYLYVNGWSSRESIAHGCGLTMSVTGSIIREELSLREIERTPAGGGPVLKLYALADVKRRPGSKMEGVA
jgi:hypothetical protein